MRELGPVGGWHCVQPGEYIYDPSHESPETALLVEAPEAVVLAANPDVSIDWVEVDLRSGDATVWTHVAPEDVSRVYVLSPGRLRSITYQLQTLCDAGLADWQIVGVQSLG